MGKFKLIKSTDENFVELELERLAFTEKAYFLSDGDRPAAWVPKSLIEEITPTGGDMVTVVMPEWLARDKNFI